MDDSETQIRSITHQNPHAISGSCYHICNKKALLNTKNNECMLVNRVNSFGIFSFSAFSKSVCFGKSRSQSQHLNSNRTLEPIIQRKFNLISKMLSLQIIHGMFS